MRSVELGLEEPLLLVRDLLVLELPVVLDTLHGLIDILLCEELSKAFQLLLDLLFSCLSEWNSSLTHLVASAQISVSESCTQRLVFQALTTSGVMVRH